MTVDPAALLGDYLDAGTSGDLLRLEQMYGPDFVNVRTDLTGRTVRITRDQLVSALRAKAAQGAAMPPADDIEILTTSLFGESAAVVFRRVKQGRPLVYTFVWDVTVHPPQLVQEFTTEAQLSVW